MSTEDAATFRRTLALGKELAAGLDQSDILGRWMAHYVSELILCIEVTPATERYEHNQRTANAILTLWDHKSSLSMKHRPFDELSPIFYALRRLSEPQNPWDFYGTFDGVRTPSADEGRSNVLLRTALSVENTIREVVQELVVAAAATATEREQRWLQLSEHLESDGDVRRALELIQQFQYRPHGSDAEEDSNLTGVTPDLRAARLLRKASEQLNKAADLLQESTKDP